MPDRLDREAGRRLTRLYAVALALVAVLTLSAQVVVQVALHGQTHDQGPGSLGTVADTRA